MYYKDITGKILKLTKLRKSNINTFVHCDSKGEPIINKRRWLVGKQMDEQMYLIKGFDNLIRVDLMQLTLF